MRILPADEFADRLFDDRFIKSLTSNPHQVGKCDTVESLDTPEFSNPEARLLVLRGPAAYSMNLSS